MSERKEKISPEKMIKQAQKTKGYLLKKSSGIMGGWKQRYFIILNGALTYYDDEALEKQKGEIKLKQIQSIIMKSDDLFCLQTPKRQYQFRCSKESDRDLWVASLNLLKQYISEDELAKKFIVKQSLNEKKIDSFQLCGINQVRHALQILKLDLLAEQLQESRIHQRVYCQRVQNGYYVSVSIKPLQFADIDEQILAEKYISPYNFNKLYFIHFDGTIQDIAKMSQMQSLKSQDSKVVITFSDKKKVFISFKNQSEAYQISRKLCRCYEVAKQYYNPFKIVLKKNVDRIVYLFDHFKQIFEVQVRYKTNQRLTKFMNTQSNPVQSFLDQFSNVKRDLIEIDEACKVMSPARDDVKVMYFKINHQQIKNCLSDAWQSLFACFDPKNLVKFSSQLYEYWIIVNQVVADSSLLEGCFDLNKFFMGRVGQSIKQKIHLYNAQKVQFKKNKNQPISNQLTSVFYEWLKQIGGYLSQTIPLDVIFQQYCVFFEKCFDQFLDYVTQIAETWNQTLVIIGACNDLSRIKKYFKANVGAEICKGIVAQNKFFKLCGNQIIRKINQCITNLIRRSFFLIFKTIDKKLLTKPFIEIDFARICYEVLQRLQPLKTKVLQQIQYEMIMLSFDQICFFFYTMFISNNLPMMKNLKDYYVLALQKGLTEIEQYYCNIKTQTQVKKYLGEISVLKEILTCSQSSMIKCCISLYQTFQSSFNQDSIQVILRIRQTSQQNFMRILANCSKVLIKAPSSQDSESCQDFHIRSRKSTLTQSVYANSVPEESNSAKIAKQGYLQVKKTIKGISSFFSKSYCRISQGKLLEYYSPNSNEHTYSIDLIDINYCYLDSTGTEKNTFIIISQSATYHFRAANRDEAGLWIQSIYSEIKRPLFQNKSQFSEKQKKNALFKNLQAQLTTTSSNKRKTGECDDDKFFQMKRSRRGKGVQNEKSDNKPVENKSPSKFQISLPKRQKNGKSSNKLSNSRESQGTCCSTNIF